MVRPWCRGLFQRRYHTEMVEKKTYVGKATRRMYLDPVQARRVGAPPGGLDVIERSRATPAAIAFWRG